MKLLISLVVVFAALAGAAEKDAPLAVTVSATLTRGGSQPTALIFTRKGNLLRIENTTNKLEPINIVDLAANKLTIVYPHNTTFVRVDLTKKVEQPSAPSGNPSSPPMPAAGMAMPMMPPPMPHMSGSPELKKTDKTKKIQGFDCTLYTMSDRGENFEIWATNDSNLFPFRLIERDYLGRRFGPQMIEETWPELLRNKSLFPIEAVLKMEPGRMERLSFKVDKIDNHKIDNDALFAPPEKYGEINAPSL